MLERIAQFLFRYRNGLFPIVMVAIILLWPPVPVGQTVGDLLWIAGVLLIALGQLLRVVTIGLAYIKRGGKDGRFFAPDLVAGGIFAHCRNPMYVGNLLVATGIFVACGNAVGIVLGAGFFFAVYVTLVHGEERYLLGRFGDDYRAYCDTAPRWFVRLRGLAATLCTRLDWRRILNKEYGTIYVSIMVPMCILAWKIVRTGGWAQLEPDLLVFATLASLATAAYAVVRILKKQGRLDPPHEDSIDHLLAVGRARIDSLDNELLRLFNARAREVRRIYAIKTGAHIPRFDGARTADIVARVRAANGGPLSDEEAEQMFRAVLKAFLKLDGPSPTVESSRASVSIMTSNP